MNNKFGLYRVADGESTLLSESDATIPLDATIELMTSARDTRIEAWFRGGPRITATGIAVSGKIGFRVDPSGTAHIRRYEIERL